MAKVVGEIYVPLIAGLTCVWQAEVRSGAGEAGLPSGHVGGGGLAAAPPSTS